MVSDVCAEGTKGFCIPLQHSVPSGSWSNGVRSAVHEVKGVERREC